MGLGITTSYENKLHQMKIKIWREGFRLSSIKSLCKFYLYIHVFRNQLLEIQILQILEGYTVYYYWISSDYLCKVETATDE